MPEFPKRIEPSKPVPPLEHLAIARGDEVLLREEAPQGVGEGDVTEADEEGWGKTFLTLLEALPVFERRLRHTCTCTHVPHITRRAALSVGCGTD